MLQINKLKIILLTICTIVSVSLFAQSEKTSDKSTIVMTQSELDSFLSTVAEARRTQLKEQESKRKKEHLSELRSKYNQGSRGENYTYGYGGEISNQQLLREIQFLNQRITDLSGTNRMPNMSGRDNSTIIMPGNSGSANPYSNNQGNRGTTTFIPNKKDKNTNDDRINELQAMIDSLKNEDPQTPIFEKDNSFMDSLNLNRSSLKDLRRQMDSLESKLNYVDKSSKTDDSSKERSYFKQQVYFDNNSEQLKANYFPNIQDLTQILMKYPEAKILLEGWASPVGNANYNKQLSMRRAESVERAFLNSGIDATRLITSFRGEDKSSSEEQARRVDMSIVLR